MAPQTSPQVASVSELSWQTAASSNAPPSETQQQCRHRSVHRDAVNAATRNITRNTYLQKVHHTISGENMEQNTINYGYIYIEADDHQQTL